MHIPTYPTSQDAAQDLTRSYSRSHQDLIMIRWRSYQEYGQVNPREGRNVPRNHIIGVKLTWNSSSWFCCWLTWLCAAEAGSSKPRSLSLWSACSWRPLMLVLRRDMLPTTSLFLRASGPRDQSSPGSPSHPVPGYKENFLVVREIITAGFTRGVDSWPLYSQRNCWNQAHTIKIVCQSSKLGKY